MWTSSPCSPDELAGHPSGVLWLTVFIARIRPNHENCGNVAMRFESFSFGSISIDGITYEHDVVIDHGQVRKRKKEPSKKFRDPFGHTPLSIEEKIPWRDCSRLVIGTGAMGALPVMEEVKSEARRLEVKLVILPTAEAIEELRGNPRGTNAILHVTC